MVAGFHHSHQLARSPVPASMGSALPGFRLAVLSSDGEELADGNLGELAVDTERSPLYWFQGYHEAPERTAERFRHGPRYYLTGDTVRAANSLLFFSSRRLHHQLRLSCIPESP
jgi:acetyl-CoA synthetase